MHDGLLPPCSHLYTKVVCCNSRFKTTQKVLRNTDLLVYGHHSPIWDIQKEDDGSTLRQLSCPCWINIHSVWCIHCLSNLSEHWPLSQQSRAVCRMPTC